MKMRIFHNRAKKETKSLETILIDAGLDPSDKINQERLAFEFPKEFSFKDHEFKEKVIYLFNRHDFNAYSQADRKKKKAVRNIYQKACNRHLVDNYNWPKKTTNGLTKFISLPAYNTHDFKYYMNNKIELVKEFPKLIMRGAFQGLELFVASCHLGNYPARFVDALAPFLNIKRKTLTRLNILYNAAMLAVEGSTSYGMLVHLYNDPLFTDSSIVSIIKDVARTVVYGGFIIHTGIRAFETISRPYYNEFENTHTSSYSTATSYNPVQALPTAAAVIYDLKTKKKEKKQTKEGKTINTNKIN
jgi:hypothetical protein